MRLPKGSVLAAAGLVCLLALMGCAGKKDLKLTMSRETVVHAPEITAMDLDPSGVVDTGTGERTVTFTMRGDPGLQATFDVEGAFEDQAMEEIQPGVYRGQFVIPKGSGGERSVTGHLLHPPSGAHQQRTEPGLLAFKPVERTPPPRTPPPPSASPTTECTTAAQGEFDAAIRGVITYFKFDQATLTERSIEALRANREVLSSRPNCIMYVLGHSDSSGSPIYNQDLSRRRANTVAEFLQSIGVQNTRIVLRHYGAEHPVNEVYRWQNRRVELRAVNPYNGS